MGQILWVDGDALLHTAALYALLLACWFLFRERLGRIGFYVFFALAVTASVQLVGVYLVFASLIVPPLAVRHSRLAWRLPMAYAIGVAGYALGLGLSFAYDLPTGAVTVWSLAALGVMTMWLMQSLRSADGELVRSSRQS